MRFVVIYLDAPGARTNRYGKGTRARVHELIKDSGIFRA